MKKAIVFDLDGTLADSKTPMTDRMAELLGQLLEKFHVCVISGGKFEQFQMQLLANLKVSKTNMEKLHLMPTCGTRYYRYDAERGNWDKIYSEDLSKHQKDKIADALHRGAEHFGYSAKKIYGETIEDRGSQVSYSALGQDIVTVLGAEGVKLKEAWDPHNSKKTKLRDYVASLIPEFEVRSGGLTTIDVTKQGIDKAYGMRKLMEMLNITKEEILFMGDRLNEGGNDYPVKSMGIDSLEVSHWKDTALAVAAIVHVA